MTETMVDPAEVEFFQNNGYIQYHNFLSLEEVASLRQALDDAVAIQRERIVGAEKGGRESEDYERVFNQMINLWTDYPQAKEIAFHLHLGEYARQLSRCQHVRIYHDHAMIKPPGQEASRPTGIRTPPTANGPGGRVVSMDSVRRCQRRKRLPALRSGFAQARPAGANQPDRRGR